MAPKGNKKKEAELAAKMAERQRAAEDAFANADKDGSGAVDSTELKDLLWGMLQREGIKCTPEVVEEFVSKEFEKADSDGSGDVDFDEFIEYYNALVDQMTDGALSSALEEAKKAADKKAEDIAIGEDEGVYTALHTLLTILRQPSIGIHTGLNIPFKIKDGSEHSTPNPQHGASSRGLVLDLSRRAQRLLTPWGSFPIGYRLAFPSYQEKVAPVEEKDDKAGRRPKKSAVPFPSIAPLPGPAADADTKPQGERVPLFFRLAKLRLDADCMLVLRKIPNRCHFQVVELLGVKQPKGDVVSPSDSEALKKLGDRWQAQLKKNPRDPRPEQLGVTTAGSQVTPQMALRCTDNEQELVVNHLLTEQGSSPVHLEVHKDKREAVKKKNASRAANKRFRDSDIDLALVKTNNDVSTAWTMLQEMFRCENNLLDKRGGTSTRLHVHEALMTVEYAEELAEWYLKNRDPLDQVPDGVEKKGRAKVMNQKYDYIAARLGTESGLGYPTRMEVERQLVLSRGEEGKVMAHLKRTWKIDIGFMVEILAAAEVEELLTTEMCAMFAIEPLTPEVAAHVEDLYLSEEFGRDKEKLERFLAEVGNILRRAQGKKPTREEAEALLRKMSGSSEQVLSFLLSLDTLDAQIPKKCRDAGAASPPDLTLAITREDVARFLTNCDYVEANASEMMKTIWKLANPAAPKPPPKGSKKPPQPYYSEMCGFPSVPECEWALLGTRKADAEGKPLQIEKAVELLQRLDALYQDRAKHPGIVREDVRWVLDPIAKRVDLSLNRTPDLLLGGLSELIRGGQERGVKTQRKELLAAFQKFKFNVESTGNYLNAIGTLMSRQAELGVVDREEVERALEDNQLNDAKVIELFEMVAQLRVKASELGNPTREEVKLMAALAWDAKAGDGRTALVQRCLETYRGLMNDDNQLMTLFGNGVGDSEKDHLRVSILRFEGDATESLTYLKKVSEILSKGEALGWPSRELVIQSLDDNGLDQRKATAVIRDEYHRVRDLQLKEEYAKKRDKSTSSAV